MSAEPTNSKSTTAFGDSVADIPQTSITEPAEDVYPSITEILADTPAEKDSVHQCSLWQRVRDAAASHPQIVAAFTSAATATAITTAITSGYHLKPPYADDNPLRSSPSIESDVRTYLNGWMSGASTVWSGAESLLSGLRTAGGKIISLEGSVVERKRWIQGAATTTKSLVDVGSKAMSGGYWVGRNVQQVKDAADD